MSPHPRDPSDKHPVARQRLDPDAADWTDERMRAARPRIIRLNPDGSRELDDDAAAPPEAKPAADADTPPTES
ncbi:hypothetical protein E3T39_05020 [Cryobacterium suzukii]|uniref:Uncharacterized protein n=1 Tax=Cryobacterium suzukii TaxID=1259198 RepID=A0A4R9AGW4_9MICO|nr:hypothetical protein [Cryobacterium suzukii]TFD61423.1 hypothetical protein E3T39_05020 [Cryobacterium suzukii]